MVFHAWLGCQQVVEGLPHVRVVDDFDSGRRRRRLSPTSRRRRTVSRIAHEALRNICLSARRKLNRGELTGKSVTVLHCKILPVRDGAGHCATCSACAAAEPETLQGAGFAAADSKSDGARA